MEQMKRLWLYSIFRPSNLSALGVEMKRESNVIIIDLISGQGSSESGQNFS